MKYTDFRQKLYRAFPTVTEKEIEEAIQFLGRSLYRNVAESYLEELVKHPKEILGDVQTGMLVESVKESFHSCLRQIANLEYRYFASKMGSNSKSLVDIYNDSGDMKACEEIINETIK